jgi:hypothetical protein
VLVAGCVAGAKQGLAQSRQNKGPKGWSVFVGGFRSTSDQLVVLGAPYGSRRHSFLNLGATYNLQRAGKSRLPLEFYGDIFVGERRSTIDNLATLTTTRYHTNAYGLGVALVGSRRLSSVVRGYSGIGGGLYQIYNEVRVNEQTPVPFALRSVTVQNSRLNFGSKVFAGAQFGSGFLVEVSYQLPMVALTTISENESVSQQIPLPFGTLPLQSVTRTVQQGASSNFNDRLSGFGLRLGYRF